MIATAKEISLAVPTVEATVRVFVNGFEDVRPKSENEARLLLFAVVSFVTSTALTLFRKDRLATLLFLAKVAHGLRRQMEVIGEGAEVCETKPWVQS
jgi:hypothetical protein